MTILCFLQNMWVREPEKVRAMLKKNPELWPRMVRSFLFMGCLTGRRIKACFGEELVDRMIFEECTKEIAGDARTICPPDPEHINTCFDRYQPRVVMSFGKVASEAVSTVFIQRAVSTVSFALGPDKHGISLIRCPHPAARQQDTVAKLKRAAAQIRKATA